MTKTSGTNEQFSESPQLQIYWTMDYAAERMESTNYALRFSNPPLRLDRSEDSGMNHSGIGHLVTVGRLRQVVSELKATTDAQIDEAGLQVKERERERERKGEGFCDMR